MKKYFLLMIVMACACTGYAQDSLSVTTTDRSAAVVAKLSRELNLERNQENQVLTIAQKRWKNVEKFKADKTPVDWTTVNQKTLSELKKILTAEQREKLLQLTAEKKKDQDAFLKQYPAYVFQEEDLLMDFY